MMTDTKNLFATRKPCWADLYTVEELNRIIAEEMAISNNSDLVLFDDDANFLDYENFEEDDRVDFINYFNYSRIMGGDL